MLNTPTSFMMSSMYTNFSKRKKMMNIIKFSKKCYQNIHKKTFLNFLKNDKNNK